MAQLSHIKLSFSSKVRLCECSDRYVGKVINRTHKMFTDTVSKNNID